MLFASLQAVPVTRAATCRDRTPTRASIRLAPRNEPGERIVIEGRVVGRDGRPLPGIKIYAYHADARGLYTPVAPGRGVGNEADPRLCGVLRTNAGGFYRIDTVRPCTIRNLEGGEPHVHFELSGPGRGSVGGMLTFRVASQARAPDARAKAYAGVRTEVSRPVFRDAAGVWRCVKDFRLR